LRTYHVNHAAAGATVCGLRIQDCSFVGEDEHYSTSEGANLAYAKWLSNEGGFLEPEDTRIDVGYLEELSVLLSPVSHFDPEFSKCAVGEVLIKIDDEGIILSSVVMLENRQWYSFVYNDEGELISRLEDFPHFPSHYSWKRTEIRGDVIELVSDSWDNDETIQLLADHISMNRPSDARWIGTREELVEYASALLIAAEGSTDFAGKKRIHIPEIVAELLYPERGNGAYYSIPNEERGLVLHDLAFFYDFLSTEAQGMFY